MSSRAWKAVSRNGETEYVHASGFRTPNADLVERLRRREQRRRVRREQSHQPPSVHMADKVDSEHTAHTVHMADTTGDLAIAEPPRMVDGVVAGETNV